MKVQWELYWCNTMWKTTTSAVIVCHPVQTLLITSHRCERILYWDLNFFEFQAYCLWLVTLGEDLGCFDGIHMNRGMTLMHYSWNHHWKFVQRLTNTNHCIIAMMQLCFYWCKSLYCFWWVFFMVGGSAQVVLSRATWMTGTQRGLVQRDRWLDGCVKL